MKRQKFTAGAGALAVALLLGACGGSAPAVSSSPATSAPASAKAGASSSSATTSASPSPSTSPAPAGSSGTFNVGLVTDLTGNNATSRIPFNRGVTAYFNTYPNIGQRKVKLNIYDAQTNPAVAPAVFRQAVAAKPNAIIDFTLSTSTASAKPILAAAGIPCICLAAPDDWFTPKPLPWAFVPDPVQSADAHAYELAMQKLLGGSLKGKRLAISGDNTAFLIAVINDLKALAKQDGWDLVNTQLGNYQEVSWSGEAANIAASKPDGVFVISVGPADLVQSKALVTAGIKGPIIGFPGLQFSDLSALAAPNYYLVSSYPYGTAKDTPVYKAAKQMNALSDELSYEFSNGWAAAAILAHAVDSCASTCSGQALMGQLESVNNYTVPGGAVFGPMSFSKTNHAATLPQAMLVWDAQTKSLRNAGTVTG